MRRENPFRDAGGVKLYLEVKPWFVKIGDMQQLMKYFVHLDELNDQFRLMVLCAGIDDNRKNILETLGVEVKTISEIEER